MKNLDLNNYGVQEMNATEMKETDGGFVLVALIAAAAILVVGAYTLIDDIVHERQYDPISNS